MKNVVKVLFKHRRNLSHEGESQKKPLYQTIADCVSLEISKLNG